MVKDAVKPLHNPALRNKILELHKTTEQTIDIISKDEVTTAGFSAEALEKARGMIESFEKFIQDNKDEITALQILYSRPYKERLRFEQIKELASLIEKPPLSMEDRQAMGGVCSIGKVQSPWRKHAAYPY